MSTVYIGSARIDEKGNARGGAAGDQNNKEVAVQAWYAHGWLVLRAKDSKLASFIAAGMRAACANANIGYDQNSRDTLYNVAKFLGFDMAKVKTKVETDCSALVRVCIMYALTKLGLTRAIPSFRTYNEPAVLKATGLFDVLTDKAYTDHPDKLRTGDILCTKVSGHTVVVLNDGEDIAQPVMSGPINTQKVPVLEYGDEGEQVAYLQYLLAKQGYKLPKSVKPTGKYGYDGQWIHSKGKASCETEKVFRAWQAANKDLNGHPLEVDGKCGPLCWGVLTGIPCK